VRHAFRTLLVGRDESLLHHVLHKEKGKRERESEVRANKRNSMMKIVWSFFFKRYKIKMFHLLVKSSSSIVTNNNIISIQTKAKKKKKKKQCSFKKKTAKRF
jgi:hypothetical protein